ncbi:hypothetical protein KAR91_72110 [Candidatus Pacearchaeota archaeon]|nr:hypothetical protein [Candidatus Pacearchaeota archaeon]
MDYYEEIKKMTEQEWRILAEGSHKRSTEMSEPADFPIRLKGVPNHIIVDLCRNLHEIQKEMFPDLPVKHVPIAPGTEQAAIQLVLSAILRLPSTIPHQTPHSIGFGNERFWLTFTIK